MYDIRSAMLNIGIVFTPGKFKINLEKTWKTPGILVNLRSTDHVMWQMSLASQHLVLFVFYKWASPDFLAPYDRFIDLVSYHAVMFDDLSIVTFCPLHLVVFANFTVIPNWLIDIFCT